VVQFKLSHVPQRRIVLKHAIPWFVRPAIPGDYIIFRSDLFSKHFFHAVMRAAD